MHGLDADDALGLFPPEVQAALDKYRGTLQSGVNTAVTAVTERAVPAVASAFNNGLREVQGGAGTLLGGI